MKKSLIAIALGCLSAGAFASSLAVSVIDKDGKPVPDAVVVVVPTNKSVLPKTPLPMQASVVQEKMQFIPAVTLAPVGAKISFVNNDPWDHHVRSSPAGLGQFNASQAGFEIRLAGKPDGRPSKSADVVLDKPGVLGATLLGCFIHGSMRGYMFVSDSPWAAKTQADGQAVFEGLPEGVAQVKVWQADQLVDLPPQSYTVTAVAGKLSQQLTVNPRRRRAEAPVSTGTGY